MPSQHHTEHALERSREIFWTVYILDCHMSALLGVPRTLAEDDLSAQLPNFNGSLQKSIALDMHVKLAKITALIQKSMLGLYPRATLLTLFKRFTASRDGTAHTF